MLGTRSTGEGGRPGERHDDAERPRTLHGVNLSGWLVLEPWVTPSLFAGARRL